MKRQNSACSKLCCSFFISRVKQRRGRVKDELSREMNIFLGAMRGGLVAQKRRRDFNQLRGAAPSTTFQEHGHVLGKRFGLEQ